MLILGEGEFKIFKIKDRRFVTYFRLEGSLYEVFSDTPKSQNVHNAKKLDNESISVDHLELIEEDRINAPNLAIELLEHRMSGAWVWTDPKTGSSGMNLYAADGDVAISSWDRGTIKSHKFTDGSEDWIKFGELAEKVVDNEQEVDWDKFNKIAYQLGIMKALFEIW